MAGEWVVAGLIRPGSDMMDWVREDIMPLVLELVRIWDWDMKLVTSASPELAKQEGKCCDDDILSRCSVLK